MARATFQAATVTANHLGLKGLGFARMGFRPIDFNPN
jgi:hypothetical protein